MFFFTETLNVSRASDGLCGSDSEGRRDGEGGQGGFLCSPRLQSLRNAVLSQMSESFSCFTLMEAVTGVCRDVSRELKLRCSPITGWSSTTGLWCSPCGEDLDAAGSQERFSPFSPRQEVNDCLTTAVCQGRELTGRAMWKS